MLTDEERRTLQDLADGTSQPSDTMPVLRLLARLALEQRSDEDV
jgi:hypothetical protein